MTNKDLMKLSNAQIVSIVCLPYLRDMKKIQDNPNQLFDGIEHLRQEYHERTSLAIRAAEALTDGLSEHSK